MPSTSHDRHRAVSFLLAVLAIGTSGIDHDPPPANPAIAPRAKPEDWLDHHDSFVATARRGGIDLLFLGDSITVNWKSTGLDLWSRFYATRKAANFAIGGDSTQHLLWRLDHGELDGIEPRVVVLMIGTNNLPVDTQEHVFEGIKVVVGRIRTKLPGSKVLLLGVTPRGLDCDPSQTTTAPDPRVPRLNRELARLDDGRAVKFLDIGPNLLDDSGRLVQVIQPDFLHLSREGYGILAEAMEPTIQQLMR